MAKQNTNPKHTKLIVGIVAFVLICGGGLEWYHHVQDQRRSHYSRLENHRLANQNQARKQNFNKATKSNNSSDTPSSSSSTTEKATSNQYYLNTEDTLGMGLTYVRNGIHIQGHRITISTGIKQPQGATQKLMARFKNKGPKAYRKEQRSGKLGREKAHLEHAQKKTMAKFNHDRKTTYNVFQISHITKKGDYVIYKGHYLTAHQPNSSSTKIGAKFGPDQTATFVIGKKPLENFSLLQQNIAVAKKFQMANITYRKVNRSDITKALRSFNANTDGF